MDFVQELVSNLGQMASENVKKKCSVCGLHLFREGYNSGWQWSLDSKKQVPTVFGGPNGTDRGRCDMHARTHAW